MKPTLFDLLLILDGDIVELPLWPADVADIQERLKTCSRAEAKAFAREMVPAIMNDSDDVHRLKDEFLKTE